jgi:uncharacterized protein
VIFEIMKRFVIVGLAVLAALLTGVYAAAGVVIYRQVAVVTAGCARHPDKLANTPANFVPTSADYSDFDVASYFMPTYEEVTFPSRDPEITISGWYIPAAEDAANAPAVIVVHGVNDCKRGSTVLLAAGMLHRNNFNVLMIDLRDHGDSTVEDGYYAAGTAEYRDVLGAWDWLVSERSIPETRIGLFGASLGAATVMIATGEEPRVAAVWEDSGYADFDVVVRDELTRNNMPTIFAPSMVFMGQLLSGDQVSSFSPLNAVNKMGPNQAMFITHGDADTRLKVGYAADLSAAMSARGRTVTPWICEGSKHVLCMYDYPEEYEQHLTAFFRESLG